MIVVGYDCVVCDTIDDDWDRIVYNARDELSYIVDDDDDDY